MTKINTKYVTVRKVDQWLKEGKTPEQILLSWNAGEGTKKCSKGYNHGVPYDSCKYVQDGLLAIK